MSKEVNVSISLGSNTLKVGTLWFHEKGLGSASFEYDKTWLSRSDSFALEPALSLTKGTYHTADKLSLFGSIGDSCPDRWGRVLMRKKNLANKKPKEAVRTLTELDYLLGVSDEARQGALRFSVAPDDHVFLAPKDQTAIPPLLSLSKLLSATERFIDEEESEDDLRLLLAPGSSLGGARPKASVWNKNKELSIAKFPRKDDEYNVVLWEAVALELAKKAKINLPKWTVETVLDKPVLVVQRFDRQKDIRIPFLSSMSMLEASDNEQHSYLEIAYALLQYGARAEEDMKELWRRIVFSIMISNTDDHLRNHGFLYHQGEGWRLSPAYDLNPTPLHIKPKILTTAIDFENTDASLELAKSVAEDFRLSKKEANQVIDEVRFSVKNWRVVAKSLGIPKSECDYMESAFSV